MFKFNIIERFLNTTKNRGYAVILYSLGNVIMLLSIISMSLKLVILGGFASCIAVLILFLSKNEFNKRRKKWNIN